MRTMIVAKKIAIAISLVVFLVSCSGPQIKVGQSTMEDVRNQFGVPTTVEKKNGSTEWIYHIHSRQFSGRTSTLEEGCTKYTFLFNDSEILMTRDIGRRDEFCPLIHR